MNFGEVESGGQEGKKEMELGMHNDKSGLTFLDFGDWSLGLTKVMVIGENGIGDW